MDRIDSVRYRHKGGIPHRHIFEICLNNPYDTNLFSATQPYAVPWSRNRSDQMPEVNAVTEGLYSANKPPKRCNEIPEIGYEATSHLRNELFVFRYDSYGLNRVMDFDLRHRKTQLDFCALKLKFVTLDSKRRT
jgi:hypothetical protein